MAEFNDCTPILKGHLGVAPHLLAKAHLSLRQPCSRAKIIFLQTAPVGKPNMDTAEIKEAVRQYILAEFLPGEDASTLEDETPLVSGGVLDSLGSLKLVAFIEERFGVTVEAHEVDVDHLDTIDLITAMIIEKRAAQRS